MSTNTKRTVKTRRANRQSVDEMVTAPAQWVALYRGCWVFGLAIVGTAFFLIDENSPAQCRGVMVMLGALLVGIGWGGDTAIKANWKLFKANVLDAFIEDVDEEIEDYGEIQVPQTTTENSAIVYGKYRRFKKHDWQKFFNTVINERGGVVNTVTIRKLPELFPNPTATEQGHIAEFRRLQWIDDNSKLTDEAYRWAVDKGIISPRPTG